MELMIKSIYRWIVELPYLVPVFLILIGAYGLTKKDFIFSSKNDRKYIESPSSFLGTFSLVIGILAGIVGIIVGVIQIGVFFGWWPEKLT